MQYQGVWKAIGAFASALLANVITDIVVNHHPIPTTWQDGVRWAVTILGTTAGVYLAPANRTVAASASHTGQHEKP